MVETGEKNNLSFQEPDYLSSYKKIITSQFGEDGVIEKIFEIIGCPGAEKWCVEFGAGDGKTFSNNWNLIVNKSWSAVEIEADKRLYERLTRAYQGNSRVTCINRRIDFTGANTLEGVLSQTTLPIDFDLLCIDVDGNDYHIWDSLKRYSPRLVMVEFNPTIPADLEFIQPRDMKINQGSSLLSLYKLGREKGYELVAALDINAFFVRREYYPLFRIKDNTPVLVRKINKYETRLFQLYDGTLVLAGNKTLLWRGIQMDENKIQVLPKSARQYPARIGLLKKLFNKLALRKKNA